MDARLRNPSRYKSENIIYTLLSDILAKPEYRAYKLGYQVLLRHLVISLELFNAEEIRYINNNAQIDFVIFDKYGKQWLAVIEVDGFAYHENKPEQREKDERKNTILRKCGISLLRLKTHQSGEKEKIIALLNSL